MSRNHFRIVSLLLMTLLIVISLTVTTYAAVVVPSKESPATSAKTGQASATPSPSEKTNQSLATPTPSVKSSKPFTTPSSPQKSSQPPAATNALPEFVLPPESAASSPDPILPEEPATTLQHDDKEITTNPPDATVPLTPDGNLTLVDDISGTASETKQFLTVTTKAGNTFYLVIDRASDKENVYFLNLVDEADLLALIKDKDVLATVSGDGAVPRAPEPSVNPFSSTLGKEPAKPVSTSEPITGEAKQPDKTTAYFALGLIVLLLLAGGAVWFFKLRKHKKPNGKGNYLDEYDFGDEEDEISDPGRHRIGQIKNAMDLDKLHETEFEPLSSTDEGMEVDEEDINSKNSIIGRNNSIGTKDTNDINNTNEKNNRICKNNGASKNTGTQEESPR